jgi:hypothetical protein
MLHEGSQLLLYPDTVQKSFLLSVTSAILEPIVAGERDVPVMEKVNTNQVVLDVPLDAGSKLIIAQNRTISQCNKEQIFSTRAVSAEQEQAANVANAVYAVEIMGQFRTSLLKSTSQFDCNILQAVDDMSCVANNTGHSPTVQLLPPEPEQTLAAEGDASKVVEVSLPDAAVIATPGIDDKVQNNDSKMPPMSSYLDLSSTLPVGSAPPEQSAGVANAVYAVELNNIIF